jgi:hypothetical protein
MTQKVIGLDDSKSYRTAYGALQIIDKLSDLTTIIGPKPIIGPAYRTFKSLYSLLIKFLLQFFM